MKGPDQLGERVSPASKLHRISTRLKGKQRRHIRAGRRCHHRCSLKPPKLIYVAQVHDGERWKMGWQRRVSSPMVRQVWGSSSSFSWCWALLPQAWWRRRWCSGGPPAKAWGVTASAASSGTSSRSGGARDVAVVSQWWRWLGEESSGQFGAPKRGHRGSLYSGKKYSVKHRDSMAKSIPMLLHE
jgi:hypothetical protein